MSVAAIRLHPQDNVLVATRDLGPGDRIGEAGDIVLLRDIPLGHKLAAAPLQAGEKIIKYGMPIGSATAAIAAGDWVHLHNMKSDYLPAHLRGGVQEDM
jgi:hypothetical protein